MDARFGKEGGRGLRFCGADIPCRKLVVVDKRRDVGGFGDPGSLKVWWAKGGF